RGCALALPPLRQERAREIGVLEGEGPELVDALEAQGVALLLARRRPPTLPGPQTLAARRPTLGQRPVGGIGRLETPALRHELADGGAPDAGGAEAREVLREPELAGELGHLRAHVVRGDPEPVPERAEAEPGEPVPQAVPQPPCILGDRVGEQEPALVPRLVPGGLVDAGLALLEQAPPARRGLVERGASDATGAEPALRGHPRERGAHGALRETEGLEQRDEGADPDRPASVEQVLAVEREDEVARAPEARFDHPRLLRPARTTRPCGTPRCRS